MAPRQDPFALWRDQQRHPDAVPEHGPLVLTEERQAIRLLKIDELLDAHQADNAEAAETLARELCDLNRRLTLEQLAENAAAPTDAHARGIVLHIAASILDDARNENPEPDVATTTDTAIAVLNATARTLLDPR